METYLNQTVESLEAELAEKKCELFPSQYHELTPIMEEIYRLKLELEKSNKLTDKQKV
uniref:Uncharacterized protein n=1 Tax=Candidatus Kentrum sp. SD TaxID=2126332 RepID=A0A451BRP5_9GAMM|nr:MAG: hypothetical protein BECKSD772F_GA0070984_10465 [Candidatus Kentron sp. SD]VFK44458.1 MAG: hypothetical protein BECKSD772E_GA0070983_10385 [Candidatus Kentron sp. SD]VFK80930.1 MAG: hypothetical protein BECKSD772D_GA0070982_11803 [Candidatus Kentron sp. SD]